MEVFVTYRAYSEETEDWYYAHEYGMEGIVGVYATSGEAVDAIEAELKDLEEDGLTVDCDNWSAWREEFSYGYQYSIKEYDI